MVSTVMDTSVMRVEEMTELFERGQNVTECLPTGKKRFIVCVDGFDGAVDTVRKGQPVKGLEFLNPTDGSMQVLRQNGGVLVCYDSPELEGKVADYLAKNKTALKNAEGIQNFVKFLGENAGVNPATGLPDVWDSDIKWASNLAGSPERIGNGTVFSGAKAQEAVQAIPVKAGVRFQGPTGTPQIAGTEGAYILRDSTGSMHMIQARQFREAYSPVKAVSKMTLNEVLQLPVSRLPGLLREGVSSAMGASRQAVHALEQRVASTRAGQTIAKAAQTPVVKGARSVMGRAVGVGGKFAVPLIIADGNMWAKLAAGDVFGVGKDFVEGAWDLGKGIVLPESEQRKDLAKMWSEFKKNPGVVGEFLLDGAQMTGQSLLMAIAPDIGDMKKRMGHIEKPVTDKNGKPVIKNGKVQTRDAFYVAMQDKKHPSQFYFFEREGAEMALAAAFNIDEKGRILSEYNEYSDENILKRTTTEYDSTSVTSLQKRYGIDVDDFSYKGTLRRMNPSLRMADSIIGNSASTIGKPKKIVIETVLDENSPQWNDKLKCFRNDKMEFQNKDRELVCTRAICSRQTEYPIYFKDGTKIGKDIVIESTPQIRRYFFTEEEKAELYKIKEGGDPEKVTEALAKMLAKKDKEKQEHPDDTRICCDEIGENKITYGREFYKGNPALKNVKTPEDGEFFNRYGYVLARTESYADKTFAREERKKEPLNFANVSIGQGSQLAHDNSGRVIRGVLDYQHHQIKQEGVSADSAYDYMGEKAVFVHRKNENGQTEVAQMIRVNPNTGVIKEFDANGVFVDVHVPHSEKHDTLALTIQSAVKVPGFDEKAAQDRLAAARKQKEEDSKNEEKSNQERLTAGKQEENTKNDKNPNLLTALKGCATEHREETSSLDLTNGRSMP